MKIDFYFRFHTHFGESISIVGNHPSLGNNNKDLALGMGFFSEDFWHVSIEIDPSNFHSLNYHYIFKNRRGEVVEDAEKHRTINLEKSTSEYIIVVDTWRYSGDFENAFYTAPFTRVLFNEEKQFKVKKPDFYTHTFKVKAPLIPDDECVCLTGNDPQLKQWDTADPVLMQRSKEWWVAKVDLSSGRFPIAYKYGIYNIKNNEFVRYEDGDNRILYFNNYEHSETIVHDGFLHLPNNRWKAAGVAIPVFSLRSKNSFGIGEFDDLHLLAGWAEEAGLKLIQLLPINDTTATHTWRDSYPYAAISAFALHPVYINLQKVAGKKHASIVEAFSKKRKQLNELPQIDYEKVLHTKLNILHEIYEALEDDFLKDEEYQKFFDANAHWLVPYAAFCYLRDLYVTSQFQTWKTHAIYHEEEIRQLSAAGSDAFKEIAFWYFVQYHLHLQLKDAVKQAHRKGVVLKGDIPIGVYRYGCDTWTHPELFHLEYQAGAPPDDFSIKGQNWSFPTYNWKKMQENNFEWWRQRFHQMSHYFDAFRIDHILGFFRIWSIPVDSVEGIMGVFVPAHPVHIHEFSGRGIQFDYDRFCKPFISDEVIGQIFAEQSDHIRHVFLHRKDNGLYDLKEEFNTQRKVEDYFEGQINAGKRIKQGLFDLISNVILFEQKGSDKQLFHFRILMDRTSSYQHLENHVKHQLYELYVNYFYYRQDELWKNEALHKLPALKEATNMLICGEDLGMVPHSVPGVMKDLGILSLEIQRMPKNTNTEFFHPCHAPYFSVITPSTHDMNTIRGWWEENRLKTQRFFNTILLEEGSAPYFCDAWVNRAILLQHLHSPAMWCIFQFQDILGISEKLRRDNPREERINDPANPQHYWRYRMHLCLEDLVKEKEFAKEVCEYIKKSGR
jgi:4-alpha-glucanotransferase